MNALLHINGHWNNERISTGESPIYSNSNRYYNEVAPDTKQRDPIISMPYETIILNKHTNNIQNEIHL